MRPSPRFILAAALGTEVGKTLEKDNRGGVPGPISQTNFPVPYGLRVDTGYSFRLCGRDQGAPNGACAQTLTFRTKRPDGDLVRGIFATQFTGIGHTGSVHAESNASGGSPPGDLNLPGDLGNTFSGGARAWPCTASRQRSARWGRGSTAPGVGAAQGTRIPHSGGVDTLRWTVTPNGLPPNCAGATFGDLFETTLSICAVYDTP